VSDVSEPSLLCVHPHPDDETIACGGVLAGAVDRGIATHVVTCTGGEAGGNLAGIDLGGRDMTRVRRDEMAAAVEALGIDGHTWLGYRDSGMVDTDDNRHPDAFMRADLYHAAARLAALIRRLRPTVVVSDDEHGTYGHPDHVMAHRVTTRAVAIAADVWWHAADPPWQVAKRYVHTISRSRMFALHELLTSRGLASPFGEAPLADPADLPFGSPDEVVTTRVDVTAQLDRKQAAMRAHSSQIADDSFFLNVPDELADAGFGVEEFSLVDGTAAPGSDGTEHDLFAGLVTVGPVAGSGSGGG
jgi:N-acetyl-1-D-myo-inositol-2-amino-2-deoxy-alpha-D-glucopyranoside deacetylase